MVLHSCWKSQNHIESSLTTAFEKAALANGSLSMSKSKTFLPSSQIWCCLVPDKQQAYILCTVVTVGLYLYMEWIFKIQIVFSWKHSWVRCWILFSAKNHGTIFKNTTFFVPPFLVPVSSPFSTKYKLLFFLPVSWLVDSGSREINNSVLYFQLTHLIRWGELIGFFWHVSENLEYSLLDFPGRVAWVLCHLAPMEDLV